jgi:hypothetical protein
MYPSAHPNSRTGRNLTLNSFGNESTPWKSGIATLPSRHFLTG